MPSAKSFGEEPQDLVARGPRRLARRVDEMCRHHAMRAADDLFEKGRRLRVRRGGRNHRRLEALAEHSGVGLEPFRGAVPIAVEAIATHRQILALETRPHAGDFIRRDVDRIRCAQGEGGLTEYGRDHRWLEHHAECEVAGETHADGADARAAAFAVRKSCERAQPASDRARDIRVERTELGAHAGSLQYRKARLCMGVRTIASEERWHVHGESSIADPSREPCDVRTYPWHLGHHDHRNTAPCGVDGARLVVQRDRSTPEVVERIVGGGIGVRSAHGSERCRKHRRPTSGRIDNLRSSLATMFVHVVFDGVADGSLGVGLDVVTAAARCVEAGLAVLPRRARPLAQRVLSLDGKPVRSGAGRSIAVDGELRRARLNSGDVLVVPGLSAATEKSIERLLVRDDVVRGARYLAKAASAGARVAASCSATFVLAAAGLLAGQSATTTWWLVPAFARRFPDVALRADRMVVEAKRVTTAGSAFAHADLMLSLLARVASPTLAHLVARYLVLDARPSQSRYMILEHLRTQDPSLRRVERFVVANLDRQLGLAEIAHAASTSPRTLARRMQAGLGVSPLEFVQRVRVQHAAHLLDTTRDSVDAIAARVGYADAAAFRRVFRKHLGESPRGRIARS